MRIIALKLGVGDHPPERMARHELEQHFAELRALQRHATIYEIMGNALEAARKVAG